MAIWSFLMCKKVQVQGLILNHNYNLCKNSHFFKNSEYFCVCHLLYNVLIRYFRAYLRGHWSKIKKVGEESERKPSLNL